METPKVLRNKNLSNIIEQCTPLKIPSSPYMKSLGFGTCVNVYRFDRSPKCGKFFSPLAIKRVSQRARLTREMDSVTFNKRIQEEAKILRKLSHPNIIGYRGITQSPDGVDSLALEFCGKSLGDLLEDRKDNEEEFLAAPIIRLMIIQISSALDYLHTEAKMIHGDLKSYNILVKGNYELFKLCDFGVSLALNENDEIDFSKETDKKYFGTNLWNPPEIIETNAIIDCKVDIFSFGLIIYETLVQSPPHVVGNVNDGKVSEETESEVDIDESFIDTLEPYYGTRPILPEDFECTPDYYDIIGTFYSCTCTLPEDRPMAKKIWTSMQNKENKEN